MTEEQFIRAVRQALNHLYEPLQLERNVLTKWFHIDHRNDTAIVLQHMLREAIDSLKPEANIPETSRPWRVYEILLYRYVQQFSHQEVAEQLGLSVRHLRREHQIAIETITAVLEAQLPGPQPTAESPQVASAGQEQAMDEAISGELAWMRESLPTYADEFVKVMEDVATLARPLAQKHRVTLHVQPLDVSVPMLTIHPVGLRQSLLSILSKVISVASGGAVEVTVGVKFHAHLQYVAIQITRSISKATGERSLRNADINLDMVKQLASFCGAKLSMSSGNDQTLTVSLIIPTDSQVNVMVIDDNPDAIQLMQRYVSGSRYHLKGVTKAEQVFVLAHELQPQLIVLDVMMPDIDGWDMLGRLQQHPLTENIPVIVCTILAQRELAIALGASDFIQKPVHQATFRAVLDRVTEQTELTARANR